jgi:phosphate transport system substrate-binding protein
MEEQNKPVANPPAPAKPLFSTTRLLALFAVGAAVGLAIYLSPQFLTPKEEQPTYPRLELGGTSTAYVVVENEWKTKYRDQKGVSLSYDSSGTTAGVNRLIDGTYAIAFTHGPLSAEQRQKAKEKGGDVIQIPVFLCGVAPVYNLKELKGKPALNLTGEVLADIFLGKIKTWNDPAIKTINPGVDLPATAISVVHRKDSSGTTQIFTEYLAAVSPAWREKVGPPASEVKWPVGASAPRNLGVATKVYETEGAIGYVDRMFTSYDLMVLDYAAVQNHDKSAFVRAEPEGMTAALAGLGSNIPEDLSFDLTNKPGKDSYPISGVIYAACRESQPAGRRQAVVDFLHWATHDGQPHAAKMSYAPLPADLTKRIDQRLDTIKSGS